MKARKQLTDAGIDTIISMKSKYSSREIAKETGFTRTQVLQVINAKKIQPKKKNHLFDWGVWGGEIIV